MSYKKRITDLFRKIRNIISYPLGFCRLAISDSFLDPITYIGDKDKGVYYLQISKAACSSIKHSMFKLDIPDDYSIHWSRFNRPDMYFTKLPEDAKFSFTFVRSPLQRLVSCYYSKYHYDKKHYRKKNDFRDYLNGYLRKDEGFDVFIRKITRIPQRFMDRHFVSQYLLTHDRHGKQRVDLIGQFEKLEEQFEPIRKEYDFWPLVHYNKTDLKNWKDFYTLKTAEMVHRKFARDFLFFDYEDEYQGLLKYLKEKEKGGL